MNEPAAAAPPRLAPFAGFPVLFAWGVRRSLSGKRAYLAGGLALLAGLGLGAVQRGSEGQVAFHVWWMLDRAFLGIALPLLALALVGGGFGEEVQDHTLLFHLVRPVSRRTLYVARYAAGLPAAVVAAAAMLVAAPLAAGLDLPASTLAAVAGLGAVGVATVGALYYALAAIFRRGLIAGLAYTFLVEGLFQFLPGSIQKLSLMHHVRSLHHRWTDDAFLPLSRRIAEEVDGGLRTPRGAAEAVFQPGARETWTQVDSALWICAAVVGVALFLGARAVARKDFALKD